MTRSKGEDRELLLNEQYDAMADSTKPALPDLRKACVAEMFGTMVLILIGLGSVVQTVLGGGHNGSYLSINFGFALGVVFGIYICGVGGSGGHLNPAISVALAIHGKFPWKRVLPYMAAQFIGSFIGTAVVYLLYLDAIDHHEGGQGHRTVTGPNATAGLFATYPQPYLSTRGGIVDQLIGTAVLSCAVFSLIDKRNPHAPPPAATPVLVGLVVFAIGTSMGMNSGYAINPARDFPPRVFTWLVYGGEVWTVADNWGWIPAIVPFFGAALGSYVYKLATM